MDAVNSLISNIDNSIYQELKSALELGRWQSGTVLSASQKDLVLQAIIAYEVRHLPEHERTAYIHKPEHEACDHAHESEPGSKSESEAFEEKVLQFKPFKKN